MYAIYPGSIDVGFYADSDDATPFATGTITVEEPKITTNLTKEVLVNTTMDFTTALSNIGTDSNSVDFLSQIYTPEITVASGAEHIKTSNLSTESLSTSENLEFIDEGSVTIKVSYLGNYDSQWDNQPSYAYTVTKEFTFNIVKELSPDDSTLLSDNDNTPQNGNDTGSESITDNGNTVNTDINNTNDNNTVNRNATEATSSSNKNVTQTVAPKTGDTAHGLILLSLLSGTSVILLISLKTRKKMFNYWNIHGNTAAILKICCTKPVLSTPYFNYIALSTDKIL